MSKAPAKRPKLKEIVEYRHKWKPGFIGSVHALREELKGRVRELGPGSTINMVSGDVGLLLAFADASEARRRAAEAVIFALAPASSAMDDSEAISGDEIVNLTTTMARLRRCHQLAIHLRSLPDDHDFPDARRISAAPAHPDMEGGE